MKASTLVACLAVSVAAALSVEPWATGRSSPFAFEAHIESRQTGVVQLYYDIGRGMNEADSSVRPIVAGHPATLRFPLPYGRFRALRFDPLDRDTRMTVSGARIVDGSGRTILEIYPRQFEASAQIDSLEVRGDTVRIATTPGGGDPQLSIRLAAPFELPRPPLWRRVAPVFLVLTVGLALAGWGAPSLVHRARPLLAAMVSSPVRAIIACALLGTVAANYPVLFSGRSLVTPSFGVALLYGQSPWIPGTESADVALPNTSDVAALMWHHLPLSMIERRATLGFGELPLWNRYDSTGSPLLGQGQSCFGDPLNLLPILADGASWAWDLKFLLAKGLFACGVGLCAWRMFRHLPASLLVAASVPFIGFFVYRINHPAIFSLCYSPWIAYCWICCVASRSARHAVLWMAALIGANLAEMNSGTVKECYVLLLLINLTGLCVLLTSGHSLRVKARLLLGLSAAGAVFAMVGAPVWLTFFHALGQSYTSYNAPTAFQLQPGMLAGLFDEAFYRPFQAGSGVVNPSANVFVLLGVLWAVVRWRALVANRYAAALALASVPALALAFGVVPPGVISRIPFLGNVLHVDNTFSCGLIVDLALLSAFGWSEAWDRAASDEGRREAWVVLVLLLLMGAAYLGTTQSVLRGGYADQTWGRLITVDPFIYGYGLALTAAAAVLLASLRALRRGGPAVDAALVYALLAFTVLHWRMGLHDGDAFPAYVVHPTRRVDLQARSPSIEALRAGTGAPFRVAGFYNDLLPGWSGVYGLEGVSGPDALVNRYYREFMDAAGIPRVWDWRYMVETGTVDREKPIFDLLNVRYYLGYHEDARQAEASLKLVRSEDMDTFESISAWPRAFFTDSVAVYRDAGQLCSWIRAGDGRPLAGIEGSDWAALDPAPRVSGDLSTRRVVAATDYALTPNTSSFTVSATGPGFIVLTEAYEPGNFQATLDGLPVPYLRVNHAFKGIYVDQAGTYRVSFRYWPSGFSTSLALCACGLVLLLLGICAALCMPPARSLPDFAGS